MVAEKLVFNNHWFFNSKSYPQLTGPQSTVLSYTFGTDGNFTIKIEFLAKWSFNIEVPQVPGRKCTYLNLHCKSQNKN